MGAGAPGRSKPASARLASFASHWSVEAAHPTAAEIDTLRGVAPAGTEVFLPAVPGQPRGQVVEAAARLNGAGLVPVPHLAARQFASEAALAAFLQALAGAGVERALVIAGDRDDAAGPFADALTVIASGLLQDTGIRRIGIGGYPEGHPRIAEPVLARAMADKLAAARDAGLAVQIVTQFCFDAAAILGWLRALRVHGIAAPVRIGLVGPTGTASLMKYAARCGVRASARGLVRNLLGVRGLISRTTPDSLLGVLSEGAPALGPVKLHYYSFGGVTRTADYARAAASGHLAD